MIRDGMIDQPNRAREAAGDGRRGKGNRGAE